MSESNKFKNFFTDLANTTPYLKMAARGGEGSGKTWTLALIAIGLYKKIKSQKPIVIFDSETASKFLKDLFAYHKIPAIVKESIKPPSLSDLGVAMDYCNEGNSDILFIDSITPVYESFLDTYEQKVGRKIRFDDWAKIKPLWRREFNRNLVCAKYHALFTGREGFTYEYQINEETGKRELVTTGTKMKVESDTGYEADVIVRMERHEVVLTDKTEVWRTATVTKGRGGLLDGETYKLKAEKGNIFDYEPTYKHFRPVIDFLFDNPVEPTETTSFSDHDLIQDEETEYKEKRETKIMLERNNALLDKVAYGTGKAEKALKIALLDYAYMGETSELAITKMSLDQLTDANDRLTQIVTLITKINRGETKCYPLAKVVTAARLKYLETENLGEVPIEKLEAYLQHMADKVIEEQKTKAKKEAAEKTT